MSIGMVKYDLWEDSRKLESELYTDGCSQFQMFLMLHCSPKNQFNVPGMIFVVG